MVREAEIRESSAATNQGIPGATKGKEARESLWRDQEGFWTSGPQNCEMINF